MDPRLNPYSPGAGTPPPELAGRDNIIEPASVALDRIRAGRAARSLILYGLRGVGKTVLLNRIRIDAEARNISTVRMEAPEERSLPALLAPALRSTLIRLTRLEAVKAGLRVLEIDPLLGQELHRGVPELRARSQQKLPTRRLKGRLS